LDYLVLREATWTGWILDIYEAKGGLEIDLGNMKLNLHWIWTLGPGPGPGLTGCRINGKGTSVGKKIMKFEYLHGKHSW
jgi:hypothetical protein